MKLGWAGANNGGADQMTDVTFRDLGRVAWGPTLKLAIARGVSSALVITTLMTLLGI